jgi:hypothetical protein
MELIKLSLCEIGQLQVGKYSPQSDFLRDQEYLLLSYFRFVGKSEALPCN